MTRTATRRYQPMRQHLSYVARDRKLFWLTPHVLTFGQSYPESARLPRIVQPFLQGVTAGTQENAYLSVMDGDDIVCIARNGGNRAVNIGYVLGSRVQAQVTAAGLLMMALCKPDWQEGWLAIHELKTYTSFSHASKDRVSIELARIRTQGWAISEQPLGLNHRRIAVPLRDRHGEVAGSLSVTIPMGYKSSEDAVARVCPCCARPLKPCAT